MRLYKIQPLSGFNLAFLFGVFWLFSVKDAVAASWDCAKSSTVVEIAICADPGLSAADEAMAELYKKAVLKSGKVKLDQIKWLRESRNSCKSAAHNEKGINSCLQSSYASRIALLEIVLDEHYIAEAEDVSVDEGAGSESRSVIQKTDGVDEQLPSPVIYQTMFDCAKATEIEALICADETLAAADMALGRLVSSRVNIGTLAAEDQENWLINVRNRCKTVDCLAEAYQQRLESLEQSESMPSDGSVPVPENTESAVPSKPVTFGGIIAVIGAILIFKFGALLLGGAVAASGTSSGSGASVGGGASARRTQIPIVVAEGDAEVHNVTERGGGKWAVRYSYPPLSND